MGRIITRKKPARMFPSINAVHGIRGYFRQDAPVPTDNVSAVYYDALPLAKNLSMGTIPAGAFIIGVDVHVKTLFNGTTPALQIGDLTDPDGILTTAASAVGTAGYKPNLTSGAYMGHVYNEMEVLANLVGVGNTAGEIDILIRFYVNSD